MNTTYTFTDKEAAYIRAAQEELVRRLRNVAEINGLNGNFSLAPDGSGFVVPENPNANQA